MTSEAPQTWFVTLQDDLSSGRVLVGLRSFLKYNRRMNKQLKELERKTLKAIPQLARRGKLRAQGRISKP